MTILLDINEIKWKKINTTVAGSCFPMFDTVLFCFLFLSRQKNSIKVHLVIKEVCFTYLVKDNTKIKTVMHDTANQTITNWSAMKKIM